MQALTKFHHKNLTYCLVNKFNYKNLSKLPRLKKIVIDAKTLGVNLKKTALMLLAMELVTGRKKRCTMISAKKPNLTLKIKKGNPVGCKTVLAKNFLFSFLNKINHQRFAPKTKNLNSNAVSFSIKSLQLKQINLFYALFDTVPNKLGLTLVFKSNRLEEISFLIKKEFKV